MNEHWRPLSGPNRMFVSLLHSPPRHEGNEATVVERMQGELVCDALLLLFFADVKEKRAKNRLKEQY